MKAANLSRWIFVLDYNADPETDSMMVKKNLEDELGGVRGEALVIGEKIILNRTEDALAFKLRFNDNIVSIKKYKPKVLVVA